MFHILMFISGVFSGTSGLILPTTKPDGSTDLVSILNHMNTLEKSVTTLQSVTKQLELELQTTKSDLQTTKTALQRSNTETTSLKDELQTVKGKLALTSSELSSMKTEMTSLETEYNSLKAHLNLTIIDAISHDVKSNMAVIKVLQAESDIMKHVVDSANASAEACIAEVSHFNDNIKTIALQQNSTISDISMMQSDIDALSMNVSGIERTSYGYSHSLTQLSHTLALKTQDIAFHAYLTTSRDTVPNRPVKFDGVYHNAGNGYNTTTGKFTAPVAGTYMFSAQVEIHNLGFSQSTYIKIVQAGITISESYGETSKTTDDDDITITVTAITHVTQGEEVWITSINDVHVFSTRYSASHFLGALFAAS